MPRPDRGYPSGDRPANARPMPKLPKGPALPRRADRSAAEDAIRQLSEMVPDDYEAPIVPTMGLDGRPELVGPEPIVVEWVRGLVARLAAVEAAAAAYDAVHQPGVRYADFRAAQVQLRAVLDGEGSDGR